MAKTPPPAVVSVTEVARTGLDILKRKLVPAPIAVIVCATALVLTLTMATYIR